MIKFLKLITITGLFMALISCSTSRYNYEVDPTPLVKGSTKYSLKDLKVNLKTKSDVKGYLSSEEMTKIFQDKTASYLKNNNILDTAKDSYELFITINYTRVFVQFSDTITFPQFNYTWKIEKNGKIIATYVSKTMKVTGGLGSGMNVFTKLGSSDINPEVEPGYIEIIAKTIVENDIKDIGK